MIDFVTAGLRAGACASSLPAAASVRRLDREDRLLQDRLRVVPAPRGVFEAPLDPADRPLQRIELHGNVAAITMHFQVQLAADVAQLDGDVVVTPLVEVVVARVDGRLRYKRRGPAPPPRQRFDSD